MAYIKFRNIRRDEDGRIVRGTAELAESRYDKEKKRLSQVRLENLGKVLWLSEDKKTGIFNSRLRGLVEYCVITNTFTALTADDPRIPPAGREATAAAKTPDTTASKAAAACTSRSALVFGDVHWLISFLQRTGIQKVLQSICSDEDPELLARLYLHLFHTVLRDGSRISCEHFIEKSVAARLFPDIAPASLNEDTFFFEFLGDHATRSDFSKAMIQAMRKKDLGSNRSFGKSCSLALLPLPRYSSTTHSPLTVLSEYELASLPDYTHAALVYDTASGHILWYAPQYYEGSVISMLMGALNNLPWETGANIRDLILEYSWLDEDILTWLYRFHSIRRGPHFLVPMPFGENFPYMELFWKEMMPCLHNLKYNFYTKNGMWIGKRVPIHIFGFTLNAYLYVEEFAATRAAANFHMLHPSARERMTEKEFCWQKYKNGYSVLLSSRNATPEEIMKRYESIRSSRLPHVVLGDGQDEDAGTRILPKSAWTTETVSGMMLLDVISTFILAEMQRMAGSLSVSDLVGALQTLMCASDGSDRVCVEAAHAKVKACYGLLNAQPPAEADLTALRKGLGLG